MAAPALLLPYLVRAQPLPLTTSLLVRPAGGRMNADCPLELGGGPRHLRSDYS